jgi:hypothetical protein
VATVASTTGDGAAAITPKAGASASSLTGSTTTGNEFNLSPNVSYTVAGVYSVSGSYKWKASDYSGTEVCPNAQALALSGAYLGTYGADVKTGGSFINNAGQCSAGDGDILTFNKGQSGNFAGSGSQLGVFATRKIQGFRSASMRADAVASPAALSFSNTGSTVSIGTQVFGGNYGSNLCMTNYWDARNATQELGASINLSTLGASGTEAFYSKQPVVVITGELPNSHNVAIYIDGDVFITANASGNFGTVGASWGTVKNIPSLYIVTSGNIYIDGAVKTMGGQFIAQKSSIPNTGRISTCADPATNKLYVDNAKLIANCKNKLTVYGSLHAEHINFLRTYSQVSDAVAGEAAASSHAAEVIQFDPSIFLSSQAIPSVNNQTYDSITALPPTL